jgi:hypothetical protein
VFETLISVITFRRGGNNQVLNHNCLKKALDLEPGRSGVMEAEASANLGEFTLEPERACDLPICNAAATMAMSTVGRESSEITETMLASQARANN